MAVFLVNQFQGESVRLLFLGPAELSVGKCFPKLEHFGGRSASSPDDRHQQAECDALPEAPEMIPVFKMPEFVAQDKGQFVFGLGLLKKRGGDQNFSARQGKGIGVIRNKDSKLNLIGIFRPVKVYPFQEGLKPIRFLFKLVGWVPIRCGESG